jgi:hypothetical protein
MKLLLVAASLVALTGASLPAVAQNFQNDGPSHQQNWRQRQSHTWNNGWDRGSHRGWNNGWTSRNVSGTDPSFGNRAGINAARRTGRCVADLGYGRFEYCGW